MIKMPENNEMVDTLEPTFKWDYSDKNDLSFELRIAEDIQFENNLKLFNITEGKTFTLTIPYLEPGKKYYWSVRAVYYDKKLGDYVKSEWAATDRSGKVPYSFNTSQNAEGFDNLEEGQVEEVPLSETIENITRLTFDMNDEFSPAISRDGKKLAFVSNRTQNFEIFVKDLEQGGAGEIQRTFSSKNQDNLNPFWLQDNVNFGFYTNRLDNENWRLFSSTRGKGLTLITTAATFINPEWLYGSAAESQGKVIYTVITENNQDPTLWLFESDNNRFTQLVPGLFPDIREDIIVYCDEKSGNFDIWKMELQGNSIFKETQLTYDEGWDYDPALSPDGSMIAYVSHRSGNSDIWIIDQDGTNEMQVTFHPMADRRPQWVDNETLVFQSNREPDEAGNPRWDIWQINISR